MKRLLLFGVIGLAARLATAQDLKIPAVSSGQLIEQDFGLGKISIKYSRPNMDGRKIFNGMEPYGIVWRAGANSATVIKLTDTTDIEGHSLAPGEYSLFAIPQADEWTIIFNKTAKQWGAYSYDEKQDVLRFKVKPLKLDKPVETLTIQFAEVYQEHAILQLLWENTGFNLHLKTNIEARVMTNIDEAMKGEKKPYYMAAIWYYNHNKDMNKALAWMQEVNKAQPESFNVKYWLARIQLKLGDKQSAIASAKEGLRIANDDKNAEYIRMNKEVLHDAGAM
jgi:tetratricopeptide (TPR) repeat protein